MLSTVQRNGMRWVALDKTRPCSEIKISRLPRQLPSSTLSSFTLFYSNENILRAQKTENKSHPSVVPAKKEYRASSPQSVEAVSANFYVPSLFPRADFYIVKKEKRKQCFQRVSKGFRKWSNVRVSFVWLLARVGRWSGAAHECTLCWGGSLTAHILRKQYETI